MAIVNITTGSEKQIAWATEIANGQIAIMQAAAKQCRDDGHPLTVVAAEKIEEAIGKAIATFNSLPASKIIDIRDRNLAQSLIKQAKEAAGIKLTAI